MKNFELHLQLLVAAIISIFAIQSIPLGVSNTIVNFFSPDLANTIEVNYLLIFVFLFTYGSIITMLANFIIFISYLFKESEKKSKLNKILSTATIVLAMIALFWWHIDFEWIFQYL